MTPTVKDADTRRPIGPDHPGYLHMRRLLARFNRLKALVEEESLPDWERRYQRLKRQMAEARSS